MQQNAAGSVLIAAVVLAWPGLSFAATSSAASAPPAPALHAPAKAKKAKPVAPVKLIDINSATLVQLKTLPGIGDAEAARIIEGRPYLSKAELVAKKVIPTGPYLSLKDRVVAMQKSGPKR